jgi:hypothetical protein
MSQRGVWATLHAAHYALRDERRKRVRKRAETPMKGCRKAPLISQHRDHHFFSARASLWTSIHKHEWFGETGSSSATVNAGG